MTFGDPDGSGPGEPDVLVPVPDEPALAAAAVEIESATRVQPEYWVPVRSTRFPFSVPVPEPRVDAVKKTFVGLSQPLTAVSALSVSDPAIPVMPLGVVDGLSPGETLSTVPLSVKDVPSVPLVLFFDEQPTATTRSKHVAIFRRILNAYPALIRP